VLTYHIAFNIYDIPPWFGFCLRGKLLASESYIVGLVSFTPVSFSGVHILYANMLTPWLFFPNLLRRYILVYPQGCDVSNHLSLFLCVANHDKLLPGLLLYLLQSFTCQCGSEITFLILV
jgi:hypothetical protein